MTEPRTTYSDPPLTWHVELWREENAWRVRVTSHHLVVCDALVKSRGSIGDLLQLLWL